MRAVGATVTDAVPVPVRGTVCGLAPALSTMESDALRAPVAVGVKVTEIVQFFLGGTDGVQVLVSAKSLALVPVIPMLVNVMVDPPLTFVSVTT